MHGKNFSLILSALDHIIQLSLQVNFIKICQTNKVLVTASRDGSFCIWDIVEVWYFHTLGKENHHHIWLRKTYAKLYASACVKGCLVLNVQENVRSTAFQLSSMWNIQWSMLSTYCFWFIIYLLDISTIIYHLLLNISTGHISSTVVVVCSWRKVQSRWNRTTMLYLLNISTGLIFLSAHIIIWSTVGGGERCEAVGSVQLCSIY